MSAAGWAALAALIGALVLPSAGGPEPVAQAAGRHAAGDAARAPLHHAARLHALRPLGPRDRHLISCAASQGAAI